MTKLRLISCCSANGLQALGAPFTAPELVKDYLRIKLVGFEHQVFVALKLAAVDQYAGGVVYLQLVARTGDAFFLAPW
jgi:DNA repair protein RadC